MNTEVLWFWYLVILDAGILQIVVLQYWDLLIVYISKLYIPYIGFIYYARFSTYIYITLHIYFTCIYLYYTCILLLMFYLYIFKLVLYTYHIHYTNSMFTCTLNSRNYCTHFLQCLRSIVTLQLCILYKHNQF